MNTHKSSRDLPQTLFSIIMILALLCCAIWILQPFLLSVLWAGLIVIAIWPLFTHVLRRLDGQRGYAITLMMLFLTMIFVLPMVFSAGVMSLALEQIMHWLMRLDTSHLPTFDFLERVPVVGSHLHDKWLHLINHDTATFIAALKPWAMKLVMLMTKELTHFGSLFINGLLMLVACAVFFLHGQTIARGLRQFAFRVARERGDHAVLLAGKTVQAVAMGVVLTAVIQAAFAGLGMALCHIPSSALLTGIIFMLCLMQLGPFIIMLPAVIWLFYNGQQWSGVLLVIWMVVACSLDNILKPLLIKRGADISLLLIMAGVIGGMLTWGMIGLMVGPVLLAVSWKLLSTWVEEAEYQPDVAKELL